MAALTRLVRVEVREQVCLVAPKASPACLAAVRTAVPPGLAMRALHFVVLRLRAIHVHAILAHITTQVLLVRDLVVAGQRVQRNPRVAARHRAALAPRHEVVTIEAALVSHVVALLAEAGTCQLVSVLVSAFLTALTDTLTDVEVI